MEREFIIEKLKNIKPKYQQEGFNIIALFGSYATNSQQDLSDIDILYDVDDAFLKKYVGFRSVSRALEIQNELSTILNAKVDLTSPSGLSQKIKDSIISKALYV